MSMNEQRIQERYNVKEIIMVEEAIEKREIGYLVNIHLEGLMIIGQPLTSDVHYKVNLLLPNAIEYSQGTMQCIPLDLTCLWNEQTPRDAIFWSGCRVMDTSTLAKECIERLIAAQ